MGVSGEAVAVVGVVVCGDRRTAVGTADDLVSGDGCDRHFVEGAKGVECKSGRDFVDCVMYRDVRYGDDWVVGRRSSIGGRLFSWSRVVASCAIYKLRAARGAGNASPWRLPSL